MNRIKLKFRFRDILEYTICSILIFLSGSAAISANDDNFMFRMLALLLIALCFIYGFKYYKIKKVSKGIIIVLLFCIPSIFIEYLNYKNTILGFSFRLIWIVTFAFIMSLVRSNADRFLKCIYNIVITVSVVTLIGFVLVNVTKTVTSYIYVPLRDDLYFYRRYLGFFYAARTYLRSVFGFEFYRLQSFFWEPGVYAIYLVYALYYFIFCDRNKKKFILYVLLTSLALTMSTTGICIGIPMFFIWWVENAKVNKKSKPLMVLSALIVASIGIIIVWSKKAVGSSVVKGSYYLRMLDLLNGLSLIAKRPIFGWGYKREGILEALQNLGRGNSNGLITLGYNLGMIGLLLALIPFISCIIKSQKSERIKETVFSALFVLTNMTEPLIFSPFMIFLIVYEYQKSAEMRIRLRYIFKNKLRRSFKNESTILN